VTERVLIIMRHAKAEQSAYKRDIDRTLTERGNADARAAGAWLAGQGITPDAVLCSPSVRTRGTWHGVAIGMAETVEAMQAPTVTYEPGLYEAGVTAALELMRATADDVTTLLVIGHNPTMSGLSYRLDEARVRAAGGLRTSGIAVHRSTTAWADVTTAAMTAEHTARG
jgi:phosphohistidine phosphatase